MQHQAMLFNFNILLIRKKNLSQADEGCGEGSHHQTCYAKVWSQPWTNLKEVLESNCTINVSIELAIFQIFSCIRFFSNFFSCSSNKPF